MKQKKYGKIKINVHCLSNHNLKRFKLKKSEEKLCETGRNALKREKWNNKRK